jgi:hypothetical protein
MILLNFSHPVTPHQISQIEARVGQPIQKVIAVPVHFDNEQEFLPQFHRLLEGIELSCTEWQTEQLLVNLPALNTIAAMLLAELHGRMGHFPTIVRISPVEDAYSVRYEFAELIPLQTIRSNARKNCRPT